MQSQLLTALTFCGKEAGYTNRHTRRCCLKPSGRFAEADRMNFTFNTSAHSSFNLFRLVTDHAFRYRHCSRRETQ